MRRLKHGKKYWKIAASAACIVSIIAIDGDMQRHPLEPQHVIVRHPSTAALLELLGRNDWIYLGTVVFLTATGLNTWPTPGNWNNSANTIECIGPGANGSAATGGKSFGGGGGGGGGGYSKIVNLTLSGTINYYIGLPAVDTSTQDGVLFNYDGVDPATSSVKALGGACTAGGTPNNGGGGGAAADGIGTTKRSGGNAGSAVTGGTSSGGGGGGTGGPTAAGSNGSDQAGTSGGAGGGADPGGTGPGAGGAGGTLSANPVAGGAGTTFDGSHGCGGGGGGGSSVVTFGNGAAGGNYGGGGGGGGGGVSFFGTAGAGGAGLIVITYTPSGGGGTPAFGFDGPRDFPRKRTATSAAAIMLGSVGIDRPFSVWRNDGWEIQPPQPPHRRVERVASLVGGDVGAEAPQINFVAMGFEVAPPQPPRQPRPGRPDAVIINGGDFPAPAPAFTPLHGWPTETQTWPRRRHERAGGVMRGDDGNEFPLQTFYPHAFPVQPPPPPHPRPERSAAIMPASNVEATFAQFFPFGWPIQLPQPPHPRPEKFGALADGDDGVEAPAVVFVAFGHPVQPVQPPHPRPEKWAAIAPSISIDAVMQAFYPNGWEAQVFQPPRIPVEKRGGIMPREDGTEFQLLRWFNAGWEVQPPQPPHPRPERAGAIMLGDPGNEATYTFVTVPLLWPFQLQDPQPPHPRTERGALLRGDDGITGRFAVWLNTGWEVQPVQPPHMGQERRAAAWLRGDDGTQGPLLAFLANGWAVQPPQPPHPRPERAGAIAAGDPGNQAVYTFVPSGFIAWNETPLVYPRISQRRAGSIMRGDDGTQAALIGFSPLGFPVQPWQPPHPRPERAGAILRGEDGQDRFSRWVNAGWELANLILRPRAARLVTPADLVLLRPAPPIVGWEATGPAILRRPAPRFLALADQVLFRPAPVVVGWEPALAQLRRRPNLLGAITQMPELGATIVVPNAAAFASTVEALRYRGARLVATWDDGIEARLQPPVIVPAEAGWTPNLGLPRFRWHRAAVLSFGESWSGPRFVSVFYARTVVSQARSTTATTAATSRTVVKGEPGRT